MTHELKKIVKAALEAKELKLKSVLVSVVDLEGSSYRRPGVRMLVREDDKMIGAVSGGCVEKEILRQSQGVFKSGISKVMTYDGRYRLGCEGILYILIEPFDANPTFHETFASCIKERDTFDLNSYYSKEEETNSLMGSVFIFSNGIKFSVHSKIDPHIIENDALLSVFEQKMQPCFKLIIIGAEHDAVQLCNYASITGWEVSIVAPPDDPKSITDFPGAESFFGISEEQFENFKIDNQTAVILMTHSFVKDLKYLAALRAKVPVYLGVLGPKKRRERLFSELLEYYPDTPDAFFEQLYAPCGINIGAETPEEIAISVMAEILAVVRDKEPISLKNKKGGIHQ